MTEQLDMTRAPPVLDIDPFAVENLRDPYPFYAALRDTAPVVFIPAHNMYAVGRYEETRTVMTDYARFTSEGGIGLSDIRKPGAWRTPSPITEVDPPRHTPIRGALTKVLSPIVIRRWREVFTEEAERQAEALPKNVDLDAVRDIVQPYVLKVFPDVLGIDMPREYFLPLGEMNFNQLGPNNDLTKRSVADSASILEKYATYFDRSSMIPGGLGEQIYAAEDRGDFAPGTGGVQVRTFLRAGVDTTISGIGWALYYLATNPDEWAKVKADPSLAKNAFEEAIRLSGPASCIFRTTVADMEFSGLHLKGDTKVGCFLGAASRDGRQFPEPDAFRVERESAGIHMALGAGVHICIGQNIARLEAECILSALVRRIDRIELTGTPAVHPINTLRTLETLPLRLVAH